MPPLLSIAKKHIQAELEKIHWPLAITRALILITMIALATLAYQERLSTEQFCLGMTVLTSLFFITSFCHKPLTPIYVAAIVAIHLIGSAVIALTWTEVFALQPVASFVIGLVSCSSCFCCPPCKALYKAALIPERSAPREGT